jgi:HEAT repeat protein
MQCQDAIALFLDHLNGSLGRPDRLNLDDHLSSCPQCQAEAKDLADTWNRLTGISATEPDSAAMRRRFDALSINSLRDASPKGEPSTIGGVRRTRAWASLGTSYRPILQACAAVLLLVAGIQIGRDMRPSGSDEVRELSQEVRSLQQTVAVSLMHGESASSRLQGVGWSDRLDRPGDEVATALVDALLHDENVNVRLASIDALKRFADRGAIRTVTIRALNSESSPLVQMALIDFVVETHDREAVNTLKRLSQDTRIDATVRSRASWGVEHLEAV